ncbi:MAG: endonuclease/exonuclease/phosphatase family protein [Nocardioidaceae bacterium]
MRLRRWVGGLLALLLGAAALLTYARLAERRGALWVHLVSLTPYAVPLCLLAVLVLALVWWRAEGRTRLAAKIVTALCACALVLQLSWAAPAYVGPAAASTASAARGQPLRVMTANLDRGRAEAGPLVAAVVGQRVDVLVLEEVTPRALRRLREAGIGRVLDHRAGRAAPGRAGTIVLSRYGLEEATRLPTRLGSYLLTVDARPRPVSVVAAHVRPAHGSAAGWSADLTVVRTAAVTAPAPVVVAGDLAATRDHLALRDLAGRGFRDAATQARSGWQPTWPLHNREILGVGVPPLLAPDHVLVGEGLTAARTETVDVPGSDHRALLAILTR